MILGLFLAPDAEADIDDILEWTVERFGEPVRDGYEELINTAINELLADPERIGTEPRPDLGPGIRVVHLRSSRDHIPHGVRRILKPRHFVVYRQVGDVLQVVRVLHEAMDLSRHRIPPF